VTILARHYEKQRAHLANLIFVVNRLKLIGTYGLRCKREVWRTQLTLAKLRKAARVLLTMDNTDPRRLFEGKASEFQMTDTDEADLCWGGRLAWLLPASFAHSCLFLINLSNKYDYNSRN